ncbi:carbonic anhydrase [Desulfosporosinus sp. SB140]|uniref:carbonic anhydrase n=1 Tax=Desulfosporosinus paludis TaxID=3115649 RepID=UPI00388E3FA9
MTKPSICNYAVLLVLAIALGGCAMSIPNPDNSLLIPEDPSVQQAISIPVYQRNELVSSPEEALQLLLEGNQRFKSGQILNKDLSFTRRSELLKKGQHPFAAIVSCSDSRVPPELLFDQALGDIFVIRVAGNIVTQAELGSIEYAVEHFKVPLVMVLGHEGCGAVTAAVEGGETHGSISAIVNKIKPAVIEAKSGDLTGSALIEKCSDLNIQNSLKDIIKSSIIKEYLETKRLRIVGCKYDLDEGGISFVD